jgi:hypothetical protein
MLLPVMHDLIGHGILKSYEAVDCEISVYPAFAGMTT